MKKRILTVTFTVLVSVSLATGLIYAATRNVTSTLGGVSGDQFDVDGTFIADSLKVGAQGTGGVTFFNGTIVNETTTGGADNPVTFGDNVRIDGRLYRGATPGTTDSEPLIINDNTEMAGNLTVSGNVVANGAIISNEGNQFTYRKSYSGTFDVTQDGDAIMTYDYENDCEASPTAYDYYEIHYKKIAVPEIETNDMPDIRAYGKIDPSEGYGPDTWPDLDYTWVAMSAVMEEGYVYVLYKYVDYICNETIETDYRTTGEYNIVIVK